MVLRALCLLVRDANALAAFLPGACGALYAALDGAARGGHAGVARILLAHGPVSYTHLRAHEPPEHRGCGGGGG